MRRRTNIRWAALLAGTLLWAGGCTKTPSPETPDNPGGKTPERDEIPYPQTPASAGSFYALYADSPVLSRAVVDPEGDLAWETGNEVWVTDGENASRYTAASSGSNTLLTGADASLDKVYRAVAPYDCAVSVDGEGRLRLAVPAEQTAVKGRIPLLPAVAVSTGSDRDFRFRAVSSLIRFTISRDDIVSVMFTGNAGETVAGEFTVEDPASPDPAWVSDAGEKYISIAAEGTFEPGEYFFAVLPQSFEAGITLSMVSSGGAQAERLRTSSITLERGGMLDAADIDNLKSWGSTYRVATLSQWLDFVERAGSFSASQEIILSSDIDLAGVDLPVIPEFNARLDGKGFRLKNWKTSAPLVETLHGRVSNLVIDESSAYTLLPDADAAWIARNNEGTITGVEVYAPMTSGTEVLTGMRSIGAMAAVSSGIISGCVNAGDILLQPDALSGKSLYDESTREDGAAQYVGGIVGRLVGGSSVISCVNRGKVSLASPGDVLAIVLMGGIAGGTPWQVSNDWVTSPVTTLTSCDNEGEILYTYKKAAAASGSNYNTPFIGGVAGFVEGTLTGCTNTGAVTADFPLAAWNNNGNSSFSRGLFLGGVAGLCSQSARRCTNSAPVTQSGTLAGGAGFGTGNPCIGGVFGWSGGARAGGAYTLEDCTNTVRGALTAKYHMRGKNGSSACAGGVSGYNTAFVSGCTNAAKIQLYSSFKTLYAGGIVGLHRPYDDMGRFSTSNNTGDMDLDIGYSGSKVTTEPVTNQSMALYAGGLIGWSTGDSGQTGILSGSGNTGKITVKGGITGADKWIGGIMGYDNGYLAINNEGATEYVFNTGDIVVDTEANNLYVGGIAGGRTTAATYRTRNAGNITVRSSSPVTAGGIRGLATSSTSVARGLISYAENTGVLNITGGNVWAGGIEGYCATATGNGTNEIEYAVNGSPDRPEAGTITVTAKGTARVGGIRGRVNTSDVFHGENYAPITVNATGTAVVGGIDGQHEGGAARVKSSLSKGSINVTSGGNNNYVGGIYGGSNGQSSASINEASLSLTTSGEVSYIGGIMGRNGATVATGGSTGDITYRYTGSGSATVYASPVCGYSACQFSCTGTVGGVLTITGASTRHTGAIAGYNTATGTYVLGSAAAPLSFSRSLSVDGVKPTADNIKTDGFLFGTSTVDLSLNKSNIILTD